MKRVLYDGRALDIEPGTNLLDALLSNGIAIPHACHAGACGACLVRVTAGEVPARAQLGLPAASVARGYAYACQLTAVDELAIEPAGAGMRATGEIVRTQALSASVTRVLVRVPEELDVERGHYVTIARDGVARSYSVADRSGANLELHVRRVEGGAMSSYLCGTASPGDRVEVTGPFGSCVYRGTSAHATLVLAGTGTGLAPLWGILHDALAAGHEAPIWLFHGALDEAGLYLRDELRALARRHPGLRYVPSVCEGGGTEEVGPLDQVVQRHIPSMRGARVFVCGAPDIVVRLRRQIFLAGAAMRDISSDAFLPSARSTSP